MLVCFAALSSYSGDVLPPTCFEYNFGNLTKLLQKNSVKLTKMT